MDKPKIFIGSSSEGLKDAKKIKRLLSKSGEVKIWNEGVSKLSHSILESLLFALKQFEFAVFIIRSDDTEISRSKSMRITRDNVIFEIGLFMSHYGRDRTFIVYDKYNKPKKITDFGNIQMAYFDSSKNSNESGLNEACDTIISAIKNCESFKGLFSGTYSSAKERLTSNDMKILEWLNDTSANYPSVVLSSVYDLTISEIGKTTNELILKFTNLASLGFIDIHSTSEITITQKGRDLIKHFRKHSEF
jgi:hypothetical protein